MFCRYQAIGLSLICLGVGMLVGGILPYLLLKWLFAITLIVAGILIARM